MPLCRSFALPGLPPAGAADDEPELAGAPGAGEPPVCALALAADTRTRTATRTPTRRLVPADACIRKTNLLLGPAGLAAGLARKEPRAHRGGFAPGTWVPRSGPLDRIRRLELSEHA